MLPPLLSLFLPFSALPLAIVVSLSRSLSLSVSLSALSLSPNSLSPSISSHLFSQLFQGVLRHPQRYQLYAILPPLFTCSCFVIFREVLCKTTATSGASEARRLANQSISHTHLHCTDWFFVVNSWAICNWTNFWRRRNPSPCNQRSTARLGWDSHFIIPSLPACIRALTCALFSSYFISANSQKIKSALTSSELRAIIAAIDSGSSPTRLLEKHVDSNPHFAKFVDELLVTIGAREEVAQQPVAKTIVERVQALLSGEMDVR